MPTQPTILVADDDSDLLKALTMRLSKVGYKVITATDSYTALSLSSSSKPDLRILDVNMPAGDGVSVHERLKKLVLKDVPVIYMTGDKSDRLDGLAKQVGAVKMLHKPFDLKYLLETIKQALSAKAA